jgi:methyl-accepting chemotaxis protein
MNNLRQRVWIDGLQTRLTARILTYCVLYQFAIWVVLMVVREFWSALGELVPGEAGVNFTVLALLAALAFVAMLVYDTVKYVHRVVGPIYRFRKTVQAIAAGEPVTPIRLRKDDFLLDLRDDLNRMIEVLAERGLVVIEDPQAARETVTTP